MPATNGHRAWGWIRKLPSKRYHASYIGPDLARHNAPSTFTARMDAEHWLTEERRLIECDNWTAPKLRTKAKHAQSITLAQYASQWIEQRNIKPRSRTEYKSILANHISDTLGKVPLKHLSSESVRAWYAKLGTAHPRRNSHAYGLVHAVCATAVKDGLLHSNPCQIERAMNPPRKREPVILTTDDIAALSTTIAPQRFSALVLISAWCGLRWGEVIELRRKDIGAGCEVIHVQRSATRNAGSMRIDTTKSGKARTVVVPPHIRTEVKHHLDTHTAADADALLFPNGYGNHLNDTVFRRGSFRPALTAIGRPATGPNAVRVHDLRHFAGTMTARVGNLVETMARLGHSTVKASLIYQGIVSGRDAEVAEALSALATGSAAV